MSSNITLSSATRQNLLSLQGTADLLATTQNRLSTGKKVNSALDNPTNFFTADGLSSRSSSLSSLLDGISNGIQTIQAANAGLTKLQGLTEQLKSIAQQALASSNAFIAKASTGSTAITGATARNLLSTGPTQAVADTVVGAASGPAVAALSTVASTTAYATGLATVLGGAYVAPAAASTLTLNAAGVTPAVVVTFDGTETTVDAAVTKINQQGAGSGVTAVNDGGKLRLNGPTSGVEFTAVTTSAAPLTNLGLATGSQTTANGAGASSTTVTINGTDIAIATGSTQAQAMAAINAQTAITGVKATDSSGKILLTGPADGSSFTYKSGTGNKSGFATTAATATGTFVPTATTLATGLGFTTGDSFTVNGQVVNITAGETLSSLVQKVTTATNGTVSATFDATSRKFTFTAADSNTGVTLGNGSSATALVSKLGFSPGLTTFAAGLGAAGSVPPLANSTLTVKVGSGVSTTIAFGSAAGQVSTLSKLNEYLAPVNAQATVDSVTGKITITTTNDSGADDLTITASGANTPFTSGTSSAVMGGDGANSRNSLVSSYNSLLNQITQLSADAGFNGLNLLAGDNLKVVFNERGSSLLSVQGSAVNASSLGLGPVGTADFVENGSINKVIAIINSASSQLKSQASALGSNLAVVQNRQDFTKQIINVLDTGAANLTNADMNEEAANSQALSTRNSLGISALSLANQAQQAILQLLR